MRRLALTLFSSMRLESLRAALTDESNAFRAMSGVAVQGKFGPSGLTNRRRGDRRVFLLHLLMTGIGFGPQAMSAFAPLVGLSGHR